MKNNFIYFVIVSAFAAVSAEKPYNLLVSQTDEHHFKTLGCYGGKIVKTPNIDWIAKNGASGTSLYAATPVVIL